MTTPAQQPTDGAFFGQDVGVAQRALRALLDDVLAGAGTEFPTWMALRALDQLGPMDADALRGDLAGRLAVADAAAAEVLDRVADRGWVERDGGTVGLSASGADYYRGLVAAVTRQTTELYAPIDPADLAVARRVLAEVTELATARLAA